MSKIEMLLIFLAWALLVIVASVSTHTYFNWHRANECVDRVKPVPGAPRCKECWPGGTSCRAWAPIGGERRGR